MRQAKKSEKYIGRTVPARSKIHLPNTEDKEENKGVVFEKTIKLPNSPKPAPPIQKLKEPVTRELDIQESKTVLQILKENPATPKSGPKIQPVKSDSRIPEENPAIPKSGPKIQPVKSDSRIPEENPAISKSGPKIQPVKFDSRIPKVDNIVNSDSSSPSCQRQTEDITNPREGLSNCIF